MPFTMDQLEKKLLALPVEERQRLSGTLIDSVGPPDGIAQEFSTEDLEEFDRRAHEVERGEVHAIPYETAMQQLRELLSDR